MIEVTIEKEQEHQRIDRFLRKYMPKASLSYLYKMLRKDVKLNGKRVSPETMLKYGDILCLYISEEEKDHFQERRKTHHAKKQFTVIYEDEHILIVNKPKGLLVHGDQKEKKNTLVNQVLAYLIEKQEYIPAKDGTFSPASVNRLDRNTSGLIIFGKNYLALQNLNEMMRKKRSIRKFYLTIAEGELKKSMVLKGSLTKDQNQNKVLIGEEGKEIETVITPLQVANGYSFIEVELITGRTHQIRAHLASQKLYVLGDSKYGSKKGNLFAKKNFQLESQFLHAYQLKFETSHPMFAYLNGKTFVAPLPPALARIKEAIFGEK